MLYFATAIRPELITDEVGSGYAAQNPLVSPVVLDSYPEIINMWFRKYLTLEPIIDTIVMNYADGNVNQFHFSRICDALKYAHQIDINKSEKHYESIIRKYANNKLVQKLASFLGIDPDSSVEVIGKTLTEYRGKVVHPIKPLETKGSLLMAALMLDIVQRSYVLNKIGVAPKIIDQYQSFEADRHHIK